MRKKRISSLAFLILVLCLIWGNSSLPGDESAALSGGLLAWLQARFPIFTGLMEYALRKAAHFSEFALLAVAISTVCAAWNVKKPWLFVPSGGLFSACVDETIQIFVPGRGSSLIDVWIDFSGVLTGFLIFWGIYWLLHRKNPEFT